MSELYIGTLSGTSVDGIDAALVRFSPEPELIVTHCAPFPPALRETVLSLCRPGENEIDRLGQADVLIGQAMAQAVQALLAQTTFTARDICAIGSHGQTIRHRSKFTPAFTLQIGDPNVIATLTGIPVVADFRRKDLALGGQGAPLVPAFHDAVFRSARRDRVIVNIGGIANLTALPGGSVTVLGFDTGPGNTLLDGWCRQTTGETMDREGQLAAQGTVRPALLKALLQDPYFHALPPKSTGPEYFSLAWLQAHLDATGGGSAADIQATLVALTARTIADAIKKTSAGRQPEIFICGGGAHNPQLRAALAAELTDCTIQKTDALGIAADWVEAMAFAWLARQRWQAQPGNCPVVTGAARAAVLGGLWLPN